MGHLMLATVTQCRDRLAGMTLARHGVDGGRTYLYGESWSWVGSQEANFQILIRCSRC